MPKLSSGTKKEMRKISFRNSASLNNFTCENSITSITSKGFGKGVYSCSPYHPLPTYTPFQNPLLVILIKLVKVVKLVLHFLQNLRQKRISFLVPLDSFLTYFLKRPY